MHFTPQQQSHTLLKRLFFMTGAVKYAPTIGNETLHWRKLLERTACMFY